MSDRTRGWSLCPRGGPAVPPGPPGIRIATQCLALLNSALPLPMGSQLIAHEPTMMEEVLPISVRNSRMPVTGTGRARLKTRLAVWLGLELLLASVLSSTACILRTDHARAWIALQETPTPATRAEWKRQQNKTFWSHVGLAGFLWAGMATITVPVMVAVSRR